MQRNSSSSSNKNVLDFCASTDSNIIQWKDLENDHDNLLSSKPSSNLELLVNQFNSATPEVGIHPEKIPSSKYYAIEEMNIIEILHKKIAIPIPYKRMFS